MTTIVSPMLYTHNILKDFSLIFKSLNINHLPYILYVRHIKYNIDNQSNENITNCLVMHIIIIRLIPLKNIGLIIFGLIIPILK